jgi:hypothetical protein
MSITLVLFAIAVGFVSAGVMGSLWKLMFDEEPSYDLLFDLNPTMPSALWLLCFRHQVLSVNAPSGG